LNTGEVDKNIRLFVFHERNGGFASGLRGKIGSEMPRAWKTACGPGDRGKRSPALKQPRADKLTDPA
jgi:hypothetical protein